MSNSMDMTTKNDLRPDHISVLQQYRVNEQVMTWSLSPSPAAMEKEAVKDVNKCYVLLREQPNLVMPSF